MDFIVFRMDQAVITELTLTALSVLFTEYLRGSGRRKEVNAAVKKKIFGRMAAVPVLLAAVAAMFAVSFFVYAGIYYHADEKAEAALKSDEEVTISRTGFGWLFDGPGTENALVFYPGGKVEETSYAPLLHGIAQQGMDVCLVKMPFRLAVFGAEKADDIISSFDYSHWYIGGHSLGGAMAAGYASSNTDQLDGLILLAAYSTKKLSSGLDVVLIYGSEDGVLNRERYTSCLENIPDQAAEHIIQGGNHAQFGSYGEQKGDGIAAISPDEQIDETIAVIMPFILESVRPSVSLVS